MNDVPGRDVHWVSPEAMRALLGAEAPPAPNHALHGSMFVRLGIASIFFVNAIVAFVSPGDFESVLAKNLVGSELPETLRSVMVAGAGVNDALLAVAIVAFGSHRVVWLWVALWFLLIGGVKLMNLVV